MAFVNQEKKAKIAAALKAVIPTGWKTSLSVRNHSTITLTIISAPIDLVQAYIDGVTQVRSGSVDVVGHVRLNHYYLDNVFTGDLLATFEAIKGAMNTDNFDNSDIQTDYFHVGHYIEIQIGRWNKAFQFKPAK